MRAAIQKLSAPQRSSFIYQVKSSKQFRFNWHFHPEYELTLISRGHGKRFVADSIDDFAEGDLVLLGPNLPHTWQSEINGKEHHKAIVIQFSWNFLGDEFFEASELRHAKGLLERCSHGLSFSGKARSTAVKHIQNMGKLSGVQRLTLLLETLDILARSRKAEVISSPGFVPSLQRTNHRRIDRVCEYINKNYQQDISQPEVAEMAQMSPSSFSTFFKKTVGHTFVDYVNNLRISHACRLLIETDHSILEICHLSGFNNLSNFNRRFLNFKGCSPKQYRAEYNPQLP